ncbi:hypothetical protein [Desulforamulus ruminis]|uniref:YtxH-like protein n=1 Tax=Desulforamulus ruminis (strain ATCC 23193 / DSM 2154 / NCIMB 8452 / DL) TaxID=696281 RepID=F6DUX7_DESRL|nr:hypothetical protein [Desulforamulus ruminis]AEG61374.1 hypothetical protein Desru_3163 [Desulforamulus ruminis DSM 2154]
MGFWRGVIAGSLLGAAMGMAFKPQRKPEKMLLGTTRKARNRAQKMMKGMSSRVSDMIR